MGVKKRKVWRWLWRSTAVLLLVIVSALCWALFTESGRLWLVDTALAQVNQGTLTIQLNNLQSDKLGSWYFDKLTVVTDNKKLFSVNNAELVFTPIAILKGQLLVNTLHADQVAFWLPEAKNDATQDKPTTFSLPSSPLRITINELSVDKIALPEDFQSSQPVPREWKLSGQADLFAPFTPPTLTLDIVSLSQPKTHINFNSQVMNYHEIAVTGHLKEEPQGFISTLLTLPEQTLALDFKIHFVPAESDWNIHLQAFKGQILKHKLDGQGEFFWSTSEPAFNIEALTLTIDEKPQKIVGSILPQLELNIDLKELPLDIANPWLSDLTGGQASGSASVNWDYQPDSWPSGHAQLHTNATYSGYGFSSQISGSLQNKNLQISQFTFGYKKTKLNAKGQLDWNTNKVTLIADAINLHTNLLKDFKIPLPDYLSTLNAMAPASDIEVQGSLDAPSIQLKTHVKGKYQQQPFDLHLAGTGNKQSAQFKQLQLITGGGKIAANGVLDWSGKNTNLAVSTINLNEQLLTLVPEQFLPSTLTEATFLLNGDTKIAGELSRPRIDTNITLSGTYPVEQEQLPFELRTKGIIQAGSLNTIRIHLDDFKLAIRDQPVVLASGTYEENNLDFDLQITRLPTHVLSAFGWDNITGEAHANINLAGNFENPKLSGNAEFTDYFYSAEENPRKIDTKLSLGFVTAEDSTLTLQTRYFADQENLGELQLQLPLRKYLQQTDTTFPLEATTRGTVDLTLSKWFLDPELHQLTGTLNTDLQLAGSLESPQINGSLTLSNGFYANQIAGTQWENIHANIKASGETLTVETLELNSGEDGTIDLTGQINWAEHARQKDKAITLQLQAHDATILQRKDLSGKVNGKIDVHGSFSELWVNGVIEASPLNANIDTALQSSIPSIKVTQVENSNSPASQSYLPTINLDLLIESHQQAFLRGRGLDAELEGRLRVSGTADSPDIAGVFRTRRGKMELFGKRFRLKEGEVQFSNEVVSLLIPAEYSTDDLEITAELYGTADNPKIRLSSVPSLPEDEILSIIIFGKSVKDITPFQAYQLASTINTLRNGSGFDPLGTARDLLGVDDLEIDSSESDEGTDFSVGVGKYISDKVYVQFKKSSNPVQPWEANMQIELTPSFQLETRTTEHGGGGAELIWKRDY